MIRLPNFQRRRKTEKLLAPTLSAADRRHLEIPGTAMGLPAQAIAEMERDAMIQTALTIKRQAVLVGETRIVPGDASAQARAVADFVEETFERMDGSPRSTLSDAMDAFAHGMSVQELVWEPEGDRIRLRAARPKDPKEFGLKFTEFGEWVGLVHARPGEPETVLPIDKFVVYRYRCSFDAPKGRSDLEAAYPHFRTKKALTQAWRAHLERFASPTLLARYQRGVPESEQNQLLDALRNLHDRTAVVFPNEVEITALHGRESDNNAFQDAIEFHNREIARAILGQTLTTDEGRRVGSLALGKVHLQVLMLQIEALRRELADSVMTEQVIRPLVEMNFGDAPVPRFEFVPSPLEAFTRGQI